MRYALPQPYEDLGHTADVGVAVRGASAEEALARLVLAFGALVAGGGDVPVEREERIAAGGGPLAHTAIAVLRELVYRFATERLVPAACEVVRLDERGADVRVGFGRYDPARHAEGADVKAVTYHAARLEPDGGGWRAQAVFDV